MRKSLLVAMERPEAHRASAWCKKFSANTIKPTHRPSYAEFATTLCPDDDSSVEDASEDERSMLQEWLFCDWFGQRYESLCLFVAGAENVIQVMVLLSQAQTTL